MRTCLLFVILCLVMMVPGLHAQQASATAAALRSMFNVERAPEAKAMGLYQANFLDSLPVNSRALQLAVVVDSTESMAEELPSIRATLPLMFSDLHRIHDGAMSTTIVTYSDVGQSETPARVVNPSFIADNSQTQRLIDELKIESGRPYFPESVDLGVFTAIDQLQWSADEQTERWLLVVGDAPPYDDSFVDEKTNAKRWYDTGFLVDLANKKKLKIHCLLCPSRADELVAYEQSLAKTRQFMSQLSEGTGGQMIDLSYPLVRQKMIDSAKQPESAYARIGYITGQEIEAVRNPSGAAVAEKTKIRVAVMPYMPLESMTFFHDKPAVQLATEIRQAIRSLPNVQTVATRQMEDELLRLQGEGIPAVDWPQALCLRLRADYVVTGEIRVADGLAYATTNIFGRELTGSLIQLATTSPSESLAAGILADLSRLNQVPESLRPLHSSLDQLGDSVKTATDATGILSTLDENLRGQFLGAFEALEQSLAFPLGDEKGATLLEAAEKDLTSFLQAQPEHAFAWVLQASCSYNQAKLSSMRGESEKADQLFQKSRDALKSAWRLRTQLIDRLTRLEVEADYALMVSGDYPAATKLYEEIVTFSESSPVRPALRAHWMLSGIHLGAWGTSATDQAIVNPEQARQHLLKILAFWPTSSEASAIKRYTLYDEKTARSRTPYLPIDPRPFGSNAN